MLDGFKIIYLTKEMLHFGERDDDMVNRRKTKEMSLCFFTALVEIYDLVQPQLHKS